MRVEKSADDHVWVATLKGAAVVDPAEWIERRRRLSAPPVHIEAVMLDDRSLADPARRPAMPELTVPPGVNRLEFRYTAVNLSGHQQGRFRYRMSGLDNDWIDAGERREAVYHRLPPGRYRFQVSAAGRHGPRNEDGATLAVVVLPAWWQTHWFRGLLAAILFGAFWFTRFVRLRQVRREHQRQAEFTRRVMESQEAERKRIARELHDGMGQHLMLIKNTRTLQLRQGPRLLPEGGVERASCLPGERASASSSSAASMPHFSFAA